MSIESQEPSIEDLDSAERTDQPRKEQSDDCRPDGKDDSQLVEVIFKGNRRAVFLNSANVSVAGGSHVIVEADKGEDLGRVGLVGSALGARRKGKRKEVLRLAADHELRRWAQLRPREEEGFRDFKRRVARRQMPMKAVDVEYQLDGKKICFYFTADHRVDFRELVRELASVYRTRIELRQIGVRDEAMRLGGMGPCGRELCCSRFLSEFAPISTQMARDQNLSLNPSKLSGLCGRLKCCLRFEHEFYREARSRFPRLGARLVLGGREGHVSRLDFFKDAVCVRFCDGDEQTITLDQVAALSRSEEG